MRNTSTANAVVYRSVGVLAIDSMTATQGARMLLVKSKLHDGARLMLSLDLPVDNRGPRRKAVGWAQYGGRRDLALHPDNRAVPHHPPPEVRSFLPSIRTRASRQTVG